VAQANAGQSGARPVTIGKRPPASVQTSRGRSGPGRSPGQRHPVVRGAPARQWFPGLLVCRTRGWNTVY